MSEKTVYILGAGASCSANLPTQAGLLPLVFSLKRDMFQAISASDDLLSQNINTKLQRIQEYYPKFDIYRQNLGRFILSNFACSEKANKYNVAVTYANKIRDTDSNSIVRKEASLLKAYEIAKQVNISLEDLFTIFDSVNSGREHFKLYSPKEMAEIHNQLKLCIIYSLSYSIATVCKSEDYEVFSKFLIKQRLQSTQQSDPFTVITMNWDDVFETIVDNLCQKYNALQSPRATKIFPDLCFYNYSITKAKGHIPSTHIKAKGYKNIKILKMHGSLAWLECPKCGRIFTDFANEIASEEFSDTTCPYCTEDTYETDQNPILRSLIITPTFMKSLDNLNVKNIWHNAFIDVSEADHLVFIGYSFPEADFEMRCLLKKSAKNNTDVKVVLSKNDNPNLYINQLISKGYDDSEARKMVNKMMLPEDRYKAFFGQECTTFYYNGFSSFVKELGGLNDE